MITLHQKVKNWDSLNSIIKNYPKISKLSSVLETYKPDVYYDGFAVGSLGDVGEEREAHAGLFNAPAGSYVHHSYQGGLVDHYLQMLDVHQKLKLAGLTNFADHKVVETVVLHDLHKGRFNFIYSKEEKPGRWFEYSKHPEPSLLGNNGQTLAMLMNCGYVISCPEVMNALLHSEGGWAKSPPKWCTPLAKYCYLLDEFSSNVLARQEKGNIWDHLSTKEFNNTWNLHV
jgi:hypothetical protein